MERLTHLDRDKIDSMAFGMFDWNSDGFISQIDLFMVMGSCKKDLSSIYPEFKVINKALLNKRDLRKSKDPIKGILNRINRKAQSMDCLVYNL